MRDKSLTPSSTERHTATGFLRTSADVLRRLKPDCAAPYFSPDNWANLLRTAEAFPASLSLSFMFERQLGAAASPIDFSHMFTRPIGGDYFLGRRDILAGKSEGMPEAFYGHDAWRRIRNCARAWLDESSPLHEMLAIWLEHDVPETPQEIPIPIVFFTTGPQISPAPALEILQRWPYHSPQLSTFRRCWEAIPETTRYRTAGILYSRPTQAIRLIFLMTPDDAFGYLESVGWPGSVKRLSERVRKFLRFHGEVALHVDAHPEGLGPQVCLEIYVDEDALYRNAGGDCAPLVNLAVEESLCLPELRDALLGWSGSGTFPLSDGEVLSVERRFHHLKVVSHPDINLRAKAYTTAEFEVIK